MYNRWNLALLGLISALTIFSILVVWPGWPKRYLPDFIDYPEGPFLEINGREEMKLGRDEEWILEVIRESAVNLPGSIIEGQESEYLAEYILGISAARNALVVASYCIRFLKGQKLIEADTADYVDGHLEQLEEVLATVTDTLRANLASGQGQFSNN